MPEEVFVLFMLLVMSMFGLTLTSMVLRHRRKQKAGSSSSETSMTTSDLEHLMRRAVEDATAPLAAKIEDLEIELVKMGGAARQLEAHDPSSRLSLDEMEEEVLDVQPVTGSKVKN